MLGRPHLNARFWLPAASYQIEVGRVHMPFSDRAPMSMAAAAPASIEGAKGYLNGSLMMELRDDQYSPQSQVD